MCNIAPGARCAGHTGAQLATKNGKLLERTDTLNLAQANLIIARQKQESSRTIRKYMNQIKKLNVQVKKLQREVSHVQRDYDGTPTGRKELELRIATCDPSEYAILNDRLVKGAAVRNWRNNALSNVQNNRKRDLWAASNGLPEGIFSDEVSFA